jgi:hypothetical protein
VFAEFSDDLHDSDCNAGQDNSLRLGGHCFDCCGFRASRQENLDGFVYDVRRATVQITRF